MIKAIIFDMDGLLVDSEPMWDRARAEMAAQAGYDWTSDDHKAVMGISTEDWTIYMIERLELSMTPEAVAEFIILWMVERYKQQIPFFPGAVEAVQLAAQHFPIGLASGSPPQLIDIVVQDARLQGLFQVVLSADTVGAGKPSPDVYLEAARQMGFQPGHCVCIEDSGNGILAGKRAGMKVIAIPDPRFPPHLDKLIQADVVVDSLNAFSMEIIQHLSED